MAVTTLIFFLPPHVRFPLPSSLFFPLHVDHKSDSSISVDERQYLERQLPPRKREKERESQREMFEKKLKYSFDSVVSGHRRADGLGKADYLAAAAATAAAAAAFG